jgi:kynurenine formamidase
LAQPLIQPGHVAAYGALPVPRMTPDLLGLVRTGEVFSLSVVYYPGIPVPRVLAPFTIAPGLRHGDLKDIGPASAAAEVMSMSAHTGTHIDALCHIGERQDADGNPSADGRVRLYAGEGKTVAADENAGPQGQKHMSIAEMPPIITRGVLLDVAGYKGVDVLPDSYEITEEDIRGTLAAQGTDVRPGTAVLVRTGFYCHLRDGNEAYVDRIAGLGLGAAKALAGMGMTLAGADNMTVEAFGPNIDHIVHRFNLTHNGITHLENLFLEDVAQRRVYEFLLIATPLRLQGATGSWVHPIAIA